MKTLLIATAALLSVGAANAGVIDPVGFANDYCKSRESGATARVATEAAMTRNYNAQLRAIKLDDGTDLDVVLSTEGISLLCPNYL